MARDVVEVRHHGDGRLDDAGDELRLEAALVHERVGIVELGDGQELVAAITRSSAERLDLQPGDAVVALVKATEVMIGKER